MSLRAFYGLIPYMSRVLSSQIQRQQHKSLRGIVTSSTLPPTDVPIERPEAIILTESSFYKQSWKDSFVDFYPKRGLHVASLDITTTNYDDDTNSTTTLESMEQTLSTDISNTSEPAYVILIARGPLQALVAQYYLESLPLAGLVLVDPLLLPEDGRNSSGLQRWEESVHTLMTMIDNSKKQKKMPDKTTHATGLEHMQFDCPNPSNKASMLRELNLLNSMKCITPRPLYVEPSSVPILVLYSEDLHGYQNHYENSAKTTAKFHGIAGDALKIPSHPKSGFDDVDWVNEQLLSWYDAFVA